MLLITNDVESGKLTTTNATVTTIVTFSFDSSPSCGVARARVFAKGQGTEDVHCWDLVAGFHMDGSGVLHVTGSIVSLLDQESGLGALGWTAAFAVSGTDLVVQVKGAATVSVDWGCYAEAEWLLQS